MSNGPGPRPPWPRPAAGPTADRRTRRPRRHRAAIRAAGILAAGVAAGVAVAACGGGPSTSGAAGGSTTTAASGPAAGGHTGATGLLAYASCMRSHGVPSFPDPGGSGGIPKQGVISAERAVSNSQVSTAANACADLLPAGGSLSGQPSRTVTAQQHQYYLSAAACMRSHGFANFPDPTFAGGIVNFPVPASIDTSSRPYAEAVHTCQKLIPAGLPYSGGSGS